MKKGFTLLIKPLIKIIIVVTVTGLLVAAILAGLDGGRPQGDSRRITDLSEVQNALELYYAKNNSYPSVTGTDSWASLTDSLVNDEIGVTTIYNDPLSIQSYVYAVSSDNQNYVLGAVFENPSNLVLKDDVDGDDIYGMNCNDPVYCVGF